LLIKVYFRTPDFPDGGKMTLGFEELLVGDRVEFKGPLGSFEWLGKLDPTLSLARVETEHAFPYVGNGTAKWRGVERKPKQIGMICGGSGEFH